MLFYHALCAQRTPSIGGLRLADRPRRRMGKRVVRRAKDVQESGARREDDVLPDNLADALWQASTATAFALERGVNRCIVEILLPEFWDPMSGPVFKEDGDQIRFWKLSRRFIENLQENSTYQSYKALYPDIGVTAMLRNLWSDATFTIATLRTKQPVSPEDEIIILAAPDPLSLEDCQRVVREMSEMSSIVMFNPRLASGDVGIGLNVRRLQSQFLSTFTTTYSLRPLGDVGSVFRMYPNQWQVFLEDKQTPGRYQLVAERATRPAGDEVAEMLQQEAGEETDGPNELVKTWIAFQNFLNSLSK